MSDSPEYLICLECETPCYTFEWKFGDLKEATCLVCAADDPDQFMTEDDFEALTNQ
jgi:hypothetical protein